MSQVEKLELSIFLPENLPTEDEMVKGIDYFGQYTPDVEVPIKTSYSLTTYAHSLTPLYDEEFNPLKKALELETGNCLVRTALASIAGRLITGLLDIPTIEVYGVTEGRGKRLHAFGTLVTSAGDVVRSDDTTGSYFFNDSFTLGNKKNFEKFIVDNPSVTEHDGIVQIRRDQEDEFIVLYDAQARTPYDFSIDASWTLFPGEEGLKSYLNTVELMSARKQERTAETWPAQLIPRI